MTEPLYSLLGLKGPSQIHTKGTFPGDLLHGGLPSFALTTAGSHHIVLSPEQAVQLALQLGNWLALLNDELSQEAP